MPEVYLPVPGVLVAPEGLNLARAKAVATALAADIRDARLVECCQRDDGGETVVIDVEPEVPQRPVHDIRTTERLAVSFEASDLAMPEVTALRADFPLVPHLNLREEEFPRSLCLYVEPWQELRLRWTATDLIERARAWLAMTARGELHAPDQPLEPLLLGSPWALVAPADLLRGDLGDEEAPAPLLLRRTEAADGRVTLFADVFDLLGEGAAPPAPQFVATVFKCPPQPHGLIRNQPTNLRQLNEFLAPTGLDLLEDLRARLKRWQRARVYGSLHAARLVLIVVLPKTRVCGGEVESTETWAFIGVQTVGEVGEGIGIWQMSGGHPAPLLVVDEGKQGDDVALGLLNPTPNFTRERAAASNGVPVDHRRVAVVGVGALGAQVFLNLVRAGFGEWALIDPDLLLPHNLGRHALSGSFVGMPKAEAMAMLANDIVSGRPVARAVVADVLVPGTATEMVEEALHGAELLVDASASVAVARFLARDVGAGGRRVSLFLNPGGSDLVLLAEDAARTIPLDLLEMQYYRLLAHDAGLVDHFAIAGGTVRYGAGCRDRSAVIPQDLVALHAATASRALRDAATTDEARVAIFRAGRDRPGVEVVGLEPITAEEIRRGEWTLYADHRLLQEIADARNTKLPNETGGVLIGAFDTARRIVYVVDQIPSPPDSQEWPTLYIRGAEGLRERVEEIERRTLGNLVYVGEWHSHPDGHGCSPSDDDASVFAWLAALRRADGLPPVMLIAGQTAQYGWFVGALHGEPTEGGR